MSGAVFASRVKRQNGSIPTLPDPLSSLSSIVGSALGGSTPSLSLPTGSTTSASQKNTLTTSSASSSSSSTPSSTQATTSSSPTNTVATAQTTSRTTASSTDSLTNVTRPTENTTSTSSSSVAPSATTSASSSSITTPPTSQSSTLPNSALQSSSSSSSDPTSTTTLIQTDTSSSATSSATPSLSAASSNSSSFFQNKALVGGVFAAVGILLLVILVALIFMRKRRRSDDIEFPPDPFKPDADMASRSPALPERFSGRDYDDLRYDPGPSPPAHFEEVPLSLRTGYRPGPPAEPPMMAQTQWGNASMQPPQPPPAVPYYPQDFEAGLLRVDPYAQNAMQPQPSNVAPPESPSDTGHSQHSTTVGSEAHLMRNASLPGSESAATGSSGASSLGRGTSSSYSRQLDPYIPPLPARPTLPDTFGSEQTLGIGDEDDYSRPRQLKIANV